MLNICSGAKVTIFIQNTKSTDIFRGFRRCSMAAKRQRADARKHRPSAISVARATC